MAVKKEPFGKMPNGKQISLYTVTNENGVSASFTDLGGTWVKLMVPDKNGVFADVLLGFDSGEEYLHNGPHFGALVGRIANRTAGGTFRLNGKTFCLKKNNGENNLHSGPDYYDKRLWEAETDGNKNCVVFSLLSPDGDQGYPGNAKISVAYELTGDNCVVLTYRVTCDQDTPVNMTNHSYFNLAGHGGGPVLDHEVQIDADFYTPASADSIPTGEILRVEHTPMDFTSPRTIGSGINADFLQLKQADGYDHNWCLNHRPGEYALCACAAEPVSGRRMEVFTDLPGVQFYTANSLHVERGKGGVPYGARQAFCFETQFFPDSANKGQFPSPTVKAGCEFVSRTGYRFSAED